MIARIHVIDSDYRRRARVARELHDRHFHAEIYEDVDEFRRSGADGDLVFAADDESGFGPSRTMRAVQASGTTLPIVAYASEPKAERIVAAMLAGALDYLAWPFEPGALEVTFDRVVSESEQRSQASQRRADACARTAVLSRREKEVLLQLVAGKSNKGIAMALEISPRTVEIHRSNMMRKLNARSVADAVRLALYAGLEDERSPE
ncbi:MAG TPA: LuxR C-terminal-related transcriptional regulator [Croceibacterium sp.]|jgi:FixJ family two-component response regulator|nr:LuxR C-terminal-related transcriptional regulator [Croceibacterium sp.]